MFSKIISPLTSRLSIRLRLTILFVSIFGAGLVSFGIGSFEFLSRSIQKEFDDALFNYAVDMTEGIELDGSGDLAVIAPQVDREKIYPFSLGTALIQIRHRSGKVLEQVGPFGELELPWQEEIQRLSVGEDPVFRTLKSLRGLPQKEAQSYRMISLSVDNGSPPQLILQIAVPRTILERQLYSRKLLFEIGIPLILILSSFVAYFLSARALRPVTEIIQRSNEIGATNLSLRVPTPPARDEVRTLAETLNKMIDRLEQSFQSQERFVADASHQLLTPLTILKGEIEQIHREKNWSSERAESLLQEVDRLTRLVQDLLLLSKVDAGAGELEFVELNLEDIVIDVVKTCEKIARPRGIRILFNIHEPEKNTEVEKIKGDPDLISHLILNLIENAVKYSPEMALVTVSLSYKDGVLLSVEDQGPGIPDSERPLVFNRFHRASNSGLQGVKGYGLGLSIAKRIADVHQAELHCQNNSLGPGCTFFLGLKKI